MAHMEPVVQNGARMAVFMETLEDLTLVRMRAMVIMRYHFEI